MGTTTFSGPIRAGNIRNTVGTTVGTDVANVGMLYDATHTYGSFNGLMQQAQLHGYPCKF